MGAGGDTGLTGDSLSALPAVHELAGALDAPHAEAVAAARMAIDERRRALLAGEAPASDLIADAREALERLRRPSLRSVINATGVLLHTNLGRAPLPMAAGDRLARTAGRDRRWFPDPGGDRSLGLGAGRGRDHEPHAPR